MTINSVLNQVNLPQEHIIIDGASVDGSIDLLKKQKLPLIKWISEKDQGIYNAMNKGIKYSKGEYLIFLNSGDVFVNENVLQNIEHELDDFDLISCKLKVVEKTKSYIKSYPEKLNFSYFLFETLPHQATFIRRSLFDKVGFYDESLRIVSDWKFFLDATCKHNASYKFIDFVLSEFSRDGISSKLSSRPIIDMEKAKILENEYKMFIEDKELTVTLMKKIDSLRKSRKIKLLIKLGLINDF